MSAIVVYADDLHEKGRQTISGLGRAAPLAQGLNVEARRPHCASCSGNVELTD